MKPFFSLVVGYRNREVSRTRRFLDSLQRQSFRDFELIFVDYGSDEETQIATEALCNQYTFCTYLYCEARGLLWNRAHALNIGIRQARGKYYLSADIDLIYSTGVLEYLSKNVSDNSQVFCQAFLLPKNFHDYSSLDSLPQDFQLSHENAIGLFHCTPLDHVRRIRGYNEYFRIWGFEDNNLANRINCSHIRLNPGECPVYHQWHPPGEQHPFMCWWWQDVSIYNWLQYDPTNIHPESWGHCLTIEDRPVLKNPDRILVEFPYGGHRYHRGEALRKLIEQGANHTNVVVSAIIHKESDIMFNKKSLRNTILKGVFNGINRTLHLAHIPIHLRVDDTAVNRSEQEALYAIYSLLTHYDCIRDYAIHEDDTRYTFDLSFHNMSQSQ